MSDADKFLDVLAGRKPGKRTVTPADLPLPVRQTLRRLLPDVGVQTDAGLTLVCQLFRYYLGKDTAVIAPPQFRTAPAPDGGTMDVWIQRRAWDVLEQHEDQLPPLEWSRGYRIRETTDEP